MQVAQAASCLPSHLRASGLAPLPAADGGCCGDAGCWSPPLRGRLPAAHTGVVESRRAASTRLAVRPCSSVRAASCMLAGLHGRRHRGGLRLCYRRLSHARLQQSQPRSRMQLHNDLASLCRPNRSSSS